MKEKYAKLIDMCKNGTLLTSDNVGEGMVLVDRGTFLLIIPPDNTDSHGDYFIYSIKGHDCYSYDSESTLTYHIIGGEGEFIIEDKIIDVKEGDIITIEPNKVFAYKGNMIIILEMTPNFKEENDHFVKKVDYDLR